MSNTLESIEKIWNTTYPDFVFDYKFLDDKINGFYKQESQLSQLYKIFAVIAIFLSCLGLYGLASFMAVQRIKEVGIRKVLVQLLQILYTFSHKEFIILISIAFIIASPITWYFMNKWFTGLCIQQLILVGGCLMLEGLVSVIIALISVSFPGNKKQQSQIL
jgi:hypothetical protein